MKNTFKKSEYIFQSIVCSATLYYWFVILYFRIVSDLTYKRTLLVMSITMIVVSALGIVLTWKCFRNYVSILCNIASSWGIFVIYTYFDVFGCRFTIICVTALVIMALIILVIFCRKINCDTKEKRKRIIRLRIRRTIYWARICMLCAMLSVLVPIGMASYYKGAVINSDLDKDEENVYKRYEISDNIDVIAMLLPETWKEMDAQSKLNVLQMVVNCEMSYLGLPYRDIVVGTKGLKLSVLGYYEHKRKQIVINTDYLLYADTYYALQTVLHEMGHAYFRELAEMYDGMDEKYRNMYLFEDASAYSEEFKNDDDNESYNHYYSKKSEQDAREYASARMEVYAAYLKMYMEENNIQTQ